MFFFLLPVGVDYEARRYPMATFWLMGVNVLVYLFSLIALLNGPEAFHQFLAFWGLVPAEIRLYAFFTAMFTHAGLLHLLGNMVYLFLFGGVVEDRIGRGLYVAFYFMGGFPSEFSHILLSSGEARFLPVVGASGAIGACLGGFLLLEPKTKINFRYWGLFIVKFFAGEFWIPAWIFLLFWFSGDLLSLVISAGDSAGGGVAFAAHVGGFISGMVMIAIARRWIDRPQKIQPAQMQAAHAVAPTILIYSNGAQSGPFTAGQVQAMLELGSISPDALYWREGMSDWGNAADLRQE